MTQTLKPRKPRNPFAVAACQRRAGRHRRSASGQRQQAERRLREERAHSP